MSQRQSSAESLHQAETNSETVNVCPLHGVAHDLDEPITPLDQVERPRDDETPGAPQLPSWRRPVPSTSSAWQELPTSVGLSNHRRPMASLLDSLVSALYPTDHLSRRCQFRFKHSPELGPDRTTAQARGGGSQASGASDNSTRRIPSRWRSLRRSDLDLLDWDNPIDFPRRFALSRLAPRARAFGDYVVSA